MSQIYLLECCVYFVNFCTNQVTELENWDACLYNKKMNYFFGWDHKQKKILIKK